MRRDVPVHYSLAAVAGAQVADAATFRVAVEAVGIGNEANPYAQALFRSGGPDAVLVAKGIVIALIIVFLAVAAGRSRRLFVLGGATATSVGLLGATVNTLALAQVGAVRISLSPIFSLLLFVLLLELGLLIADHRRGPAGSRVSSGSA